MGEKSERKRPEWFCDNGSGLGEMGENWRNNTNLYKTKKVLTLYKIFDNIDLSEGDRKTKEEKAMKKIINGKLYDTETAKEIGSTHHGEGPRDFTYFAETLYRKRTGEYFLYGEGGPMTRYAVSTGQNSWSGGERIEPMSYSSAKEWAEKNMVADEYMEEFGPVSEDAERTTLSVSIDSATADRIRREAQEKGMSVSALIASKFNQ